MKTLKIFLIAFLIPFLSKADQFDDVIAYMKAANSSGISKMMNTNVELTLVENEGMYSRQQAEMMLKNFFNQNPAKSVVVQHRGSAAQGAKYAIAIYESNGIKYRAYVFMKDSGTGLLIHELRFEKE